MWVIAKYKKKEFNTFLKEFKKKLGNEMKIYQPKVLFNRKTKKIFFKSILGNYIFLWNEKFKNQNNLEALKFTKGLEYFLLKPECNQSQITEFINSCKNHEDEKGFLRPSFFMSIIQDKAKFLTGPFANFAFKVVEKKEKFLCVFIDGFKLILKNNSKNHFQPL
jgi:hypothetical protein